MTHKEWITEGEIGQELDGVRVVPCARVPPYFEPYIWGLSTGITFLLTTVYLFSSFPDRFSPAGVFFRCGSGGKSSRWTKMAMK